MRQQTTTQKNECQTPIQSFMQQQQLPTQLSTSHDHTPQNVKSFKPNSSSPKPRAQRKLVFQTPPISQNQTSSTTTTIAPSTTITPAKPVSESSTPPIPKPSPRRTRFRGAKHVNVYNNVKKFCLQGVES